MQVGNPQLPHWQKSIYSVAVAVADKVTFAAVAEQLITVLYASVEQLVSRRKIRGASVVVVVSVVVSVIIVVMVVPAEVPVGEMSSSDAVMVPTVVVLVQKTL